MVDDSGNDPVNAVLGRLGGARLGGRPDLVHQRDDFLELVEYEQWTRKRAGFMRRLLFAGRQQSLEPSDKLAGRENRPQLLLFGGQEGGKKRRLSLLLGGDSLDDKLLIEPGLNANDFRLKPFSDTQGHEL